jgi:hypothetical protein
MNVMMGEAMLEPYQPFEDAAGVTRQKLVLAVAKELGISVVGSLPLMQGKLQEVQLSKENLSVYNHCARHLQLLRSVPSSALMTTLVGMKQNDHVRANLEVT